MTARPRTTSHFPRMKARGGRRRHHRRLTQQATALHTLLTLDLEGLATSLAGAAHSALAAFAGMWETFSEARRIQDQVLAAFNAPMSADTIAEIEREQLLQRRARVDDCIVCQFGAATTMHDPSSRCRSHRRPHCNCSACHGTDISW